MPRIPTRAPQNRKAAWTRIIRAESVLSDSAGVP